jgi:hypothetical protein
MAWTSVSRIRRTVDTHSDFLKGENKMACINAKSIRNAMKTFFKENGRDPSLEEFRDMVTGKTTKKKKVETDEVEKGA